MKKLFMLLIMISLFVSCGHDIKTDNRFYTNIDLRIVLINSESSLSDDKFHKPQLCNTVLFETLTEPKLYREFNTCNLPYNSFNGKQAIHFNTKWLYNHKAGDIVHFDYLRKDCFFTIDEEHRPKTKNPLN